MQVQLTHRFVERALAFAHVALDEPTMHNLATAEACAHDALRRIRRLEFTLSEARQIVLLVSQLRAVLAAATRRTEEDERRAQEVA
jgi:hypothetical protein